MFPQEFILHVPHAHTSGGRGIKKKKDPQPIQDSNYKKTMFNPDSMKCFDPHPASLKNGLVKRVVNFKKPFSLEPSSIKSRKPLFFTIFCQKWILHDFICHLVFPQEFNLHVPHAHTSGGRGIKTKKDPQPIQDSNYKKTMLNPDSMKWFDPHPASLKNCLVKRVVNFKKNYSV